MGEPSNLLLSPIGQRPGLGCSASLQGRARLRDYRGRAVEQSAVVPEEWVDRREPCYGVYDRVCQRVPGYLTLLVYPQRATVGAAERAQIFQHSVLPNECLHLCWERTVHAEVTKIERVGCRV